MLCSRTASHKLTDAVEQMSVAAVNRRRLHFDLELRCSLVVRTIARDRLVQTCATTAL